MRPHPPAKETRDFGRRTTVLEHGIPTDYALNRAANVNRHGNAVFHAAARNFNPNVAMARRKTIVEAELIVEAGTIDPDSIHRPGIFVHRVVARTAEQAADKDIEKRTTRNGMTHNGGDRS